MISTPDQSQSHGIGELWDRFTALTEGARRPFRRWRRGRPFFAGLSVVLAGLEIYWSPHSGIGKMLSMGIPGISAIFIGAFLVIFGVTIWFFPAYRVFSGIAAIMIALLSLIAINLGGFFLGFLLGMFGGAFAVAWVPRDDYTAETRRQRRRRVAAEAQFAAGGSAEAVAASEAAAAEPTTIAEPAPYAAGTEEPTAVQPSAERPYFDPEHVENTPTIEQSARPEEAGPAAGTTTEKE